MQVGMHLPCVYKHAHFVQLLSLCCKAQKPYAIMQSNPLHPLRAVLPPKRYSYSVIAFKVVLIIKWLET
jgi:hypothetical protein